ncbi:tRNA (guanosine(46)-N7)-methyltransferase TrmB [Tessaracoccus sp. OS52]|uniref:tRNA (guanosine(46)-N7)-methyltransferase TrmB n=1 Tax=Tessaracoccus sp. OS52 TaxID=2886691 RepID=UPI001D1014D8|nr:tRNA (guanosine(46)-N7)-methyltransferase TrmB [Tessaracoccus sp. OS52]
MVSRVPRPHRGVVSFVRRSTRMNESQARAWDRFAAQFVVDVPVGELSTWVSEDAQVDWEGEFGRSAARIVEIGSGNGESLVAMAAARPDVDFVAFEVFAPAVASTLGRMGRDDVTNIRIVMADGARGLERLFAPASISELWTFFADPWHKTRHHKRRLVNPGFADTAAAKLEPSGLWRLATDWEDYAVWQREVLDAHPWFHNVHDGWAPRFEQRPVTKYEARGLAAGRRVHDLTYARRA